jgi:hypothetical protein
MQKYAITAISLAVLASSGAFAQSKTRAADFRASPHSERQGVINMKSDSMNRFIVYVLVTTRPAARPGCLTGRSQE